MTEDIVEDTTVLIEVDGQPLWPPLPVRVRFRAATRIGPAWSASAMLPRWSTPGVTCAIQGHGHERLAALKDVIRVANEKLAEYAARRQRQELADNAEAADEDRFRAKNEPEIPPE